MLLVRQSLRGRAFLAQFFEVMAEFGHEIPWLQPLRGLQYSTNREYFRDQILHALSRDDEEVIPMQLVSPDPARVYVGGLIYFPHSPERFTDPCNRLIAGSLAEQNYHYVSCLQVRAGERAHGYGPQLFLRALKVIRASHGKFWGVISTLAHVRGYIGLGGRLESPLENNDNLWIISWS